MKINFSSITDHSNETTKLEPIKINFDVETEYNVSIENNETNYIYSFIEPQNQIKSYIKINKNKINIITGDYTLIIVLNEEYINKININNTYFPLISYGTEIIISENLKTFSYKLYNSTDVLIGTFKITIENK
ncbi:hypothetical protein [Mycoplasma sp. 1018B]|uniref:hypothetical protein n=1 Tax=Mycoplasma sp. 1018B TaxID=2967302 RepID=UPI00211C78AF|nr:hypothetical protein [Mycoplasma sp. 1018B]UUM19178.1 hypothetical protein NPA14_02490 [Mycoplasma sp. 1018B]